MGRFLFVFYVVVLAALCYVVLARGATDTVTRYEKQIHRETSTIRFFNRHQWMLARRHEDCWDNVPWARTCNIARKEYMTAKHRLDVIVANPVGAIVYVFGPRSWEALNVAWCESKYSPWARNGQYRGIFQMGSRERSIYGDGVTPLEQAVAAHRYFAAAGWSPWECQP